MNRGEHLKRRFNLLPPAFSRRSLESRVSSERTDAPHSLSREGVPGTPGDAARTAVASVTAEGAPEAREPRSTSYRARGGTMQADVVSAGPSVMGAPAATPRPGILAATSGERLPRAAASRLLPPRARARGTRGRTRERGHVPPRSPARLPHAMLARVRRISPAPVRGAPRTAQGVGRSNRIDVFPPPRGRAPRPVPEHRL